MSTSKTPIASTKPQVPKGKLSKCFEGCTGWFKRIDKEKISPLIDRSVKYLEKRSEIVYLGPAIPAFLLFVLAMITSAMIINGKTDFKTCEALSELAGYNERIDGYLLGNVILQYAFVVMYANMIIEYFKALSTIHASFLFFVAFCAASIVWNIIGVVYTKNSHCKDTSYHTAAMINLIIFFIALGIMVLYALVILILKFLKYRAAKKEENAVRPEQASSRSAELLNPKGH